MTDEEKDLKKSLIDSVNSVLQIRLEELKFDEEKDLALSSRYNEVANSFKQKVYGSAGVIATLLTALLVLVVGFRQGLDKTSWTLLTFLVIDLAVVGFTEFWFRRHLGKAAHLWFELDENYASAIALVNGQRVFLALRIDTIDIHQIRLIVPYFDVLLCECRLEIISVIKKVRSHVQFIPSVKKALVYLSNRQEELIYDAYKSYESHESLLGKEAEFLALVSPRENFDSILTKMKPIHDSVQLRKSTSSSVKYHKENKNP